MFEKWEIPRNCVSLDSVLGRGNYGVVHKGFLQTKSGREEIEEIKDSTTVAVKMLQGMNHKLTETVGTLNVRYLLRCNGKQTQNNVLRFGAGNTFLGGQDFCFC